MTFLLFVRNKNTFAVTIPIKKNLGGEREAVRAGMNPG